MSEGKLRVRVRVDQQQAIDLLGSRIARRGGIFAQALDAAITDGYKRLMAPSLEREVRAALTERAETDAIAVFAKNTEALLSQRPVRGARIIALDPGYRTGCKVAVLDEFGKLLDYATVYPTPPRSDVAGTKRKLGELAHRYNINTIVIGNGTASRETEEVVSAFISESDLDLRYTIVNEAGASVYSASKLASEEYPDLDVTTRGAMSLGRRLQDPLAELVKIPPQSIGVGQYQHDLNQVELGRALGGRLPRGDGRLHGSPPAQEGSQAWAQGVSQLCRLPAHLRRHQPAGRHQRSPRELCGGDRPARTNRRWALRPRSRRGCGHGPPRGKHRRSGTRAGLRSSHPARHCLRAGEARPRPPRRRTGSCFQSLGHQLR